MGALLKWLGILLLGILLLCIGAVLVLTVLGAPMGFSLMSIGLLFYVCWETIDVLKEISRKLSYLDSAK